VSFCVLVFLSSSYGAYRNTGYLIEYSFLTDVDNSASIQEAFVSIENQLEGLGLNLLINNAGRIFIHPFLSESEESMLQLYQTHVVGSLKMSQIFLPLLKKAAQMGPQDSLSCNRAAIINISSLGGSIKEVFAWHLYHILSYRCSKLSDS
uniref:Uncharacterized protein n=1 Tax=Monodelphis domestica TaxID=13616 RepID=A0A5F8HAH8_MONDO